MERATEKVKKGPIGIGPIPNFGAARYMYKLGFVVMDDVIQSAAKNGALPLDGALIVRLKKPVPCVFISFGLGGISLPDTGLCAIGDSWNGVTKEEKFALSLLMIALDFEHKLNLRAQWYLIDMKETDSKVIKNPTDMELTKLFKTPSALKAGDVTKYKLAARVARRRTTSGATIPDGHENDSDRDPVMVYLDEMIEKENRSEKARKKRLGPYDDTPIGWKMAKLYRGSTSKKKIKVDEAVKDGKIKKRPKMFYPSSKSAPKRKRISYNSEPEEEEGNVRARANIASSALEKSARDRALKELFGESSDDEAATVTVLPDVMISEPKMTDPPRRLQKTDPEEQQPEHSDCEQMDPLNKVPSRSDDESDEEKEEEDENAEEVDYGDG